MPSPEIIVYQPPQKYQGNTKLEFKEYIGDIAAVAALDKVVLRLRRVCARSTSLA
jgi:hypothetical protein